MVALADLWIPIVASAVAVFAVSSVIHMALPWHRRDYSKLANEDAVLAALRDQGVTPGMYLFPCAGSMKEMASEAMVAKLTRGPVGTMIVRPNGPVNMGAALAQWFAFTLVIGLFAAYVASLAVPPGAEAMRVFRLTGTVAVLGYGASEVTQSIWKGIHWGTTARFLADGLAYGLVTAGCFAWLWPSA